MDKEKQRELIAKHEDYVRIAVYNVIFTNDLVRECTSFAMMKLRDSPLDRHLVKRRRKSVEKSVDFYQKRLESCIGCQAPVLESYTDEFTSEIDKYVELLYFNVKNAFDKSCSPFSDILSRCEVARMLSDYSVFQLDSRVRELCRIDPIFSSMDMKHLSMAGVSTALNCLMGTFKIEGIVHIDTDDCLASFRSLKKALMDVNLINKSIKVE